MESKPFEPGTLVVCRDVGVETPLIYGGEYRVSACAIVGCAWMVQLCGPHGFNLCGRKTWYLAQRFKPRKG